MHKAPPSLCLCRGPKSKKTVRLLDGPLLLHSIHVDITVFLKYSSVFSEQHFVQSGERGKGIVTCWGGMIDAVSATSVNTYMWERVLTWSGWIGFANPVLFVAYKKTLHHNLWWCQYGNEDSIDVIEVWLTVRCSLISRERPKDKNKSLRRYCIQ